MRKTEVYQLRLDSQEKREAFEVFKQLGITPAQAVRLFFKQVVRTHSIPFSIENSPIPASHKAEHEEFYNEISSLLNQSKSF